MGLMSSCIRPRPSSPAGGHELPIRPQPQGGPSTTTPGQGTGTYQAGASNFSAVLQQQQQQSRPSSPAPAGAAPGGMPTAPGPVPTRPLPAPPSSASAFTPSAAGANTRPVYNDLHMGEGVVGGTNVSMQTGPLYSCTGVAMANRAEQRGGLYHYPSNTLDNQNVSNTLTSMTHDVRPDEIALTPAQGMGYSAVTTNDRADNDRLAGHLRNQAPGANVHKLQPSSLAGLSWNNGQPSFGSHGRDSGEVEVPEDYRGTMATQTRPLDGGASYYGGDGERRGVLDQNVAGTT